ncbi:LIM domain only protein 7 isoform X5 [Ictalurus punctatus]|uniref:LIM domain only protein 7 isoform X5 n=1 Tax=Ictalurus punctatus TaxID=7998 RepID=A0A2D0R6I3_ICTPU|nr:LIM domain only protein 7 isoform X5 [Ictalurus punctatus]
MMAESKEYRRSLVVTPKANTQFNQFLPSKEKQTGYVPAPLRKKRSDYRTDENRRSWASPMFTEEDGSFSRIGTGSSSINELGTQSSTQVAWPFGYESSDSEADRPDPDLLLDDLASRRFHTPSVITPTNFALPMTSGDSTTMPQTTRPKVMLTNVPRPTLTYLSSETRPPQKAARRSASADVYMYDDSAEEDDEIGYADPVQDDLYARKVGLTVSQPISTVHHDKFLPKFWTPEEDIHVQKIRLGSQRRPWYRKIQGFSQKKSGSSSEDSDCDVSPRHCVSSPSHSEPTSLHAQTSQLSPITPSPTTQPLMLMQQTSGAQRFQLPDFWPRPDPTSGPRLIKCKRHPLLGREHPNDPYNVSEDILPDLDNDDMFSRRTCAFNSNTELARMKYGGLLTSHHRSEPSIRVVTQHNDGKSTYPDIEKDDVLTRRLQHHSTLHPLSGAPNNYHPVPIPESWALPQKLQAKISAPCPPIQVAAQVCAKQKGDAHRKTDDMLVRKFGIVHVQNPTEVSQRSFGTQTGPSVPSSCSEEDLQKWHAIREASRLRYKKRLMVERLMQKNSETDGSVSLSDIPVEQAVQSVRYEELKKFRENLKESEDKWQDDLNKWKSRRRSVNSDIMKKKEEREQIETLTIGSSTRKSKTFKEMEEERESQTPGFRSRFATFSTSEDQDVFDEPTPKTRVLPSRSMTIDTPFSLRQYKGGSLPSLADDEPEAGSLVSDEVDAPSSPVPSSLGSTLNTSQGKQTSISSSHNLLDDPVPTNVTSKPSLLVPINTTQSSRTSTIFSNPPLEANSSSKPITKSSNFVSPVPAPRQFQSQPSLHKPVSAATKQPIAPQVSASLPRSYQKSDSARITSVVTPRPFGAPSTKITSLPRAYTVDDSRKRFNGETNSSKQTTVPSRYAPFVKEDEVNSQTSSVQSSSEDTGEEEEQVVPPPQTSSSVTPVSRVAPQPKAVSLLNSSQQENYSEMRISLNQKPKSSHDFGFQTNWDSMGAVVKSLQPGSQAELCHLQVGDQILAVNGQKVADMSYEQWKRNMDEALQQGSLFMDIRRQGKNNWGKDLPSLSYKSHKVINLTSADPLGSPEPNANMSLDFTSRPAMDPTVKSLNVRSQPVNSLPSNGINGGTNEEPVILRNKEPISLKNLKRRSEFFEQGGSENQIPDLPVPSLSASSTRWSWDPEEERRRQEKWQKEQERQLQEKYRRDQEKLEEEFRKAQQEAVTEGTKQYQEELRSLELEKEASRLALKEEEERRRREEERKRKEEQEHLEEERKIKEDLERLEEDRKRREEQKKRIEQKRLEEQRKKEEEEHKQWEEENRRREEDAQRLQRKREEDEERRRQEAHQRLQANVVEYTFPELSYSHRAKSKSTPELDDNDKNDIKAVSSGLGESALYKSSQNKKEPLSQAEAERQQIIQDMKKKTSLLTDNSWIRESAVDNTNKQPNSLPMRRGESLDNLDMTTNRPSWRSSWTPGTTSSIPDYSRPYSSLTDSSIQSGRPGAATVPSYQSLSSHRPSLPNSTSSTRTNPENQPSSQNRSVSGKKMCTNCDMPLGKGAAMIIESLGLCYHLQCFKCIQCKKDLGGKESGAEVRIRNKQLFCNSCYIQVKTGQPTSM